MAKELTRPNHLEVSGHFLHDAIDFEIRFRHCINSEGPLFYTPRSRRIKTFIDLRMGLESVMKAMVAYYSHNERKGKTLINWIENFGHKAGKLWRKAKPYFAEDFANKYEEAILELDSLPVGLRYRLDAWDFHGNQEALYYRTIGSDLWLKNLLECLNELIQIVNSEQKKHDRILTGDDLWKEVMESRYEKYT